MKILVTGGAGYLGNVIIRELLKNKQNKVYGIDNFDDYYSIKLKKKKNI